MHQMIEKMFREVFVPNDTVNIHDSAVLDCTTPRIAFTTDSYVVRPLFFPGGDIGKLAIFGTVNDLAMSGARPVYMSMSFIIEEGLPMETLWQVVRSIKQAADQACVRIVTGDTKVVDKGKGDGIFINTSGVGMIEHDLNINPFSVQKGDIILLNGDIARHGMAVMAVREGLEFETTIESDAAPLAEIVLRLLEEGVNIHCLRDLTRGGLAGTLNEIASTAKVEIRINETAVPVREEVKAACEILGLDPLYVANEGRFVAFIHAQDKEKALEIMKSCSAGEGAGVIGEVADENPSLVTLTSRIGTTRVIDMLSGEQLPRIC